MALATEVGVENPFAGEETTTKRKVQCLDQMSVQAEPGLEII